MAAKLHVDVDRKSIVKGDTVTLTITAEGEDVEFPVLKSIGGYPVLATARKNSISIINGKVSRVFSKSYTFAPMSDVTVPPVEVKIDSKIYKTEPLKIEVTDAPPAASSSAEVSLDLSVDKSDVHVGEPVEVEVTLKYPANRDYVEVRIKKPEFANFWIKQLGEAQEYRRGGFRFKTFRYLIFAQKPGEYRLGPLFAKLARRVRIERPFANDPFFDDDFFNTMFARLEWKRVASNSVDLHVDPLPSGVELYGDFNITASVDRREVDAGKPLHIQIRIEGYGNIDDVPKYEPDIPDAVVYADEPKIEAGMENGRYGGISVQKITVVADRNYTVPAFTLRYMDAESGRVVEKRTDPVKIRVKGGSPAVTKSDEEGLNRSESGPQSVKKSPEQPEKPGTNEDEGALFWLYLALAFLAGSGAVFAYNRFGSFPARREGGAKAAYRKIMGAKSDKELLELLLPYMKQSELIESAVHKLEENLFENRKHKIDKRELAWEVEEIEERNGVEPGPRM